MQTKNQNSDNTITITRPKVDATIRPGMTINGYTFFTTFWEDFSIAEMFGAKAIIDTAKRAKRAYKDDVKYITELALVLNYKAWKYYDDGKITLSQLYSDLYYAIHDYAMEHFDGKDAMYYFNITD